MMSLKKNDFIELEFSANVKGGEIFDSNIKEDLEKSNIKGNPKPFIFPIGCGMFLKGVDDFLIGKEIGEYHLELSPENAFGKRNPSLIQLVPKKVFLLNKINPIPGATFNIDGKLARILAVSGGRIMVDFNNPVSGKIVEYKLRVKRKVDDLTEQIDSVNDFLFRQKIDFEIKDQDLIFKIQKEMIPFAELFKDKYKEIFNLNLKIEENNLNSKS